VERISGLISFEPDKVTVLLDGVVQQLAPGQRVVAHGPDRDRTPAEAASSPGLQP
jgi:multidrug efflux pump subunit AcrA (membrane-fusion protein)